MPANEVASRQKTYEKLVDWVRSEILAGRLHPGDRLPAERDLALRLGVSRNSIREGMKVLQYMGVISPSHGSGNYISTHFGETISELLSFLYYLMEISEEEVTEYRWMIERSALKPAATRISEEQKEELKKTLEALREAESEEEQIEQDRKLHQLIVEASGNTFLIASYTALTAFMDQQVQSMRRRIIRGMKSANALESSHTMMVEGIVNQDVSLAAKGLFAHYGYIDQFQLDQDPDSILEGTREADLQ